MASASTPAQRRRARARRGWAEPSVDDNANDDVVIAGQRRATCIDLTSDTAVDEVIDLTRTHGIMDSPVVVLTPADDIGPIRRQRGSGRLGRRRSGGRTPGRLGGTSLSRRSRTHQSPSVHEVSSNSDSDDLPEAPFTIPPQTAASQSLLQTPEPVKISCPICMDDVKQIRRSHRQVVSTNCGHIFCDTCLKTAINTQHACPSCRKRLTQRSFHPLFL